MRVDMVRATTAELTFQANVNNGQMAAGSASGAFYCGAESRIDVQTGFIDAETWETRSKAAGNFAVWFFRIVLIFGCCGSVYCCCSPISTGADIVGDYLEMIPCVGETLEDILEGAVDAIVICFSCLIGCSCGLMCIMLMWAAVRPVFGVIFLVLCCLVGGVAAYARSTENPNKDKIKKKKAKKKGKQAGETELEGGVPLAEES